MKPLRSIKIFVFVLSSISCCTQAIDLSTIPDYTNSACLSRNQHFNITEYNKVEIVNNFHKYPLKDLLTQRGLTLENDHVIQEFLYCVWRNENYINEEDRFNYEKLESEIKKAIVNIVGNTGPAIHLSMAHARNIINDCRGITGSSKGQKIVKMQNYIVRKLIPFSTI